MLSVQVQNSVAPDGLTRTPRALWSDETFRHRNRSGDPTNRISIMLTICTTITDMMGNNVRRKTNNKYRSNEASVIWLSGFVCLVLSYEPPLTTVQNLIFCLLYLLCLLIFNEGTGEGSRETVLAASKSAFSLGVAGAVKAHHRPGRGMTDCGSADSIHHWRTFEW